MNDEALRLGADTVTDLDIHHNAIMKSLVALNMVTGSAGGPRRIHYNLIDLREPTASTRPQPPGHLVPTRMTTNPKTACSGRVCFTSPKARTGRWTCSTTPAWCGDGTRQTLDFLHYTDSLGGLRRSFNNVYIDAEPTPANPAMRRRSCRRRLFMAPPTGTVCASSAALPSPCCGTTGTTRSWRATIRTSPATETG